MWIFLFLLKVTIAIYCLGNNRLPCEVVSFIMTSAHEVTIYTFINLEMKSKVSFVNAKDTLLKFVIYKKKNRIQNFVIIG